MAKLLRDVESDEPIVSAAALRAKHPPAFEHEFPLEAVPQGRHVLLVVGSDDQEGGDR